MTLRLTTKALQRSRGTLRPHESTTTRIYDYTDLRPQLAAESGRWRLGTAAELTDDGGSAKATRRRGQHDLGLRHDHGSDFDFGGTTSTSTCTTTAAGGTTSIAAQLRNEAGLGMRETPGVWALLYLVVEVS